VLKPWTAESVGILIQWYEHLLPEGACPNWTLGNHDMSRIASRSGLRQARVAAMLLLTLRGTPIIYYGDELGMQDIEMASEDMLDLREKNNPGLGLGRGPSAHPDAMGQLRGCRIQSGKAMAAGSAERNRG
jgi:alpha-glucosidase